MNKSRIDKLNKLGWRIGSTADFLNLTPEESAYIDLKISLCKYLHEKRTEIQWTQQQLAHKIGSSQSRVAKMEKGDSSVSIDLLVKSLLAMGSTKMELAEALI